MSDLPFDFSETLEAFECPETITAYEKVGQYVDGRWSEFKENERSVSCILLNVDERKQEIVAEGRNLVGAYCMMFDADEDEFFIAYQQNENVQAKQTYVQIDGMEFVVVNDPEVRRNAGFRSYYALRYKDQTNNASNF